VRWPVESAGGVLGLICGPTPGWRAARQPGQAASSVDSRRRRSAGLDDVGEADAELVVDHHHFAWAMRQPLTSTSIGSPARPSQFHLTEACASCKQVADGDLGAAQFHGEVGPGMSRIRVEVYWRPARWCRYRGLLNICALAGGGRGLAAVFSTAFPVRSRAAGPIVGAGGGRSRLPGGVFPVPSAAAPAYLSAEIIVLLPRVFAHSLAPDAGQAIWACSTRVDL